MIEIIDDKCDYCGTCTSVCPVNCIDVQEEDIIIDHKMSQARYLQAIARSPRLTIGMTLPLIEELLGTPHDRIISDKTMEKQQLWIYNLKDKQLHLSFEDFILFKIEEI